MTNCLLIGKILGAAAIFIGLTTAGIAQTGPGPAAEKNEIATNEDFKPKSIFDEKAAARIWNIKPNKDETTAAMHRRVSKMLRHMVENSEELDYDTSYWRLLAFVREVPWDKLTDYSKNWYLKNMPNPRLTDEQREYLIKKLEKRPLYTMTPKELDVYIAHVHETEPDLRKRVVKLARQNLGQPYDIYLLGEFPHEVYDADPTFHLSKGDCVVFSEHMYAMALGKDWKSFYSWLQHLRYKDGEPGMVTRNHFTEADWNINNSWLVEDVTTKLDATSVTQYQEKIDRARFFRNFGIGQDIEVEHLNDDYIPAEAISSVLDKLQEGDFVNIARGYSPSGVWIGHVGLIGYDDEKATVTLIHSTDPEAVEVPIMEYVNRNVELNENRRKRNRAQFFGMKFLRLRTEELNQMIAEGRTSPIKISTVADTEETTSTGGPAAK